MARKNTKARAEYARQYYLATRVQLLAANKRRRREDPRWRRKQILGVRRALAKQRAMVAEILRKLKDKPCLDCKVGYPYYVMDFDHVRGRKLFSLGHAARHFKTKAQILKEAAKCEVVCSNCHRTRTHNRRMEKFTRAK